MHETCLYLIFHSCTTRVVVTENYHDQCDVTIDCNEFENICESGSKICVCTPGYSFQSSTNTCVSSEFFFIIVKPVLSGHLKLDKTKTLMTNGSLMQVESIAECSTWSILQYF